MGFLQNIRRAQALVARDMNAHIGDIAVLKMDAVRMQPRPRFRAAIDAIADYEPRVDLDTLARLPENTFGYAVARFMRDNGLSWFVVTDEIDPEMRRRNAYGIRLARTHDLIHVLTGFDTSWPGEMGVYAFQYGQGWSAWSPVLGLCTWLVYPFLTGFRLPTLWAAWKRGVQLGRSAPFLLGERLEDRFAEPLEQVRASYGLPLPCPSRPSTPCPTTSAPASSM